MEVFSPNKISFIPQWNLEGPKIETQGEGECFPELSAVKAGLAAAKAQSAAESALEKLETAHHEDLIDVKTGTIWSNEIFETSSGQSKGTKSTRSDIDDATEKWKPRRVEELAENMVWFCSICSDGPKRRWQDRCDHCGHNKCSSCIIKRNRFDLYYIWDFQEIHHIHC